MKIFRVAAVNLRNLAPLDLEPAPRFNLLYGENGQGKTNVLEALSLGARARSFRTAKATDAIRAGESEARVELRIEHDDSTWTQSMRIAARSRVLRLDDKRPDTIEAYALRTPIVVFGPTDVELSTGSGAERRKWLDRVSLYAGRANLHTLDEFSRAMRSRQRLLEESASGSQLDVWEELMAQSGVKLIEERRASFASLRAHTEASFASFASAFTLNLEYQPGAPVDVDEYRTLLARDRVRDRSRGSASRGPHRDDVVATVNDKPARSMASQGQHRALVLAMKLAEMSAVEEQSAKTPVLLLDDVSSELDALRLRGFSATLRKRNAQVWITTTRPEWARELVPDDGAGETRFFSVRAGEVTQSNPMFS